MLIVELQLKIYMEVVRLLKSYETSYCTVKCQTLKHTTIG